MPLLEDYSAAVRNLQQAVDNPESVTPIQRWYEWRYGLIDGAPRTRGRTSRLAYLGRHEHQRSETTMTAETGTLVTRAGMTRRLKHLWR